jgi:hypothetical protein
VPSWRRRSRRAAGERTGRDIAPRPTTSSHRPAQRWAAVRGERVVCLGSRCPRESCIQRRA